jgi:membrane protein
LTDYLPENRFLRGGLLLLRRYWRHRVGVQSAALAFYLLFAVFPFLIFISALIGLLQLDAAAILAHLRDLVPDDILYLAEMYLRYVGENSSVRLLLFGLVFSVYFPVRATNALMRSVRTAYHLGPPRATVWHWIKTLLYTLLLIAAIAMTLTLITVSDRFLAYGVRSLHLPVLAARLWTALRFPLAAVAGYFALLLLYAAAQDSRQPWRNIWPGALAALLAWLAISWGYGLYVEHIAHYSALYGSIGAVIVLLIWLNITAVILIMGAEWNGMLMGLRREGAGQSES